MTTVVAVSNNPSSPLYNANAPNITGQAGSLTTALDALLVNSFTGYTAPGWTISQTTTNKRGYKMPAGTGFLLWVDDTAPTTAKEARCTGFQTMTGLGTGTGQFPTGAQINIGTTPNGALICRKSTTADSTNRFWTFIGDTTCFYLFIETGDVTSPVGAYTFSFGDFFTYSSGDTSNCQIQGRMIENSALFGSGSSSPFIYEPFIYLNSPWAGAINPMANTLFGCYCAANFTNVGGSLPFGKHTDVAKMGVATGGTANYWMFLGRGGSMQTTNTGSDAIAGLNMPNGPDAGVYVAPVFIHHQGNVRGYLKGVWAPLQVLPLNHNDTYSGTGNLAGKSLIAQQLVGPATSTVSSGNGGTPSYGAQVHMETSSTWS